MAKILITGGAGFIGSNAAKKLIDLGNDLVLVDNLNDYYDPELKKNRLKIFLRDYKFKFFKLDITDYKALEEIFKQEKFDKVLHLAAQAGVRYSLDHPFAYEKTNTLGTLNILELCRHYRVNHLVFASSSSVYGNNKKLPFSEEDRVDTPISLYASTKKSNEEMAYVYHHLFGLKCTGLRFFTVYGPWGRPDMALFKFTKNIIADKPIDVNNNGEMFRDFTYIEDIIQGTIKALDNIFPYEIINLARGESIKLMEYIKEVENNLGKEAEKNMRPIPPGDVPATSANISKAKELLNYNPQVSVKQGVKEFINWYKEYYKN